MTIEEAIKHFESQAQCNYAPAREAAQMAIAALRSQQEPPNPPLTLEDLWEMDGEPVWNDTMKKWVLVDLLNDVEPRTVDAQGRWRDLEDRYYRRKPEEGTV